MKVQCTCKPKAFVFQQAEVNTCKNELNARQWLDRFVLFQALAALISVLMAVEIGYSVYEQFSDQVVPVVDFLSPLIIILTMVSKHASDFQGGKAKVKVTDLAKKIGLQKITCKMEVYLAHWVTMVDEPYYGWLGLKRSRPRYCFRNWFPNNKWRTLMQKLLS